MRMSQSPAVRRYLVRLFVLMTIYLVVLFAAVWTFRHGPPLGLLAWPVYRWIAGHRHLLPGGTAACSLPQAQRERLYGPDPA